MVTIHCEPTRCDLCGADDADEFARGTDYEYQTSEMEFTFVRCRRCSLVYLNPRPTAAELDTIYPKNYYSYVQRENRKQENFVSRLRLIYHCNRVRKAFGRFVEPGEAPRILDVGCGDGGVLDVMKIAFGPETITHGIDFDAEALETAARNGHGVTLGTIENAEVEDGSFDLIYISHVIEHLPSPRFFLETAHRLLKPKGVLYVETPNIDCFEARLFRRSVWGGYHFPRHWHLFSEDTMTTMAAQCRFRVDSLRYMLAPVFCNWTFHHILWRNRLLKPLAEPLFSVTGIYRGTLQAFILILLFSGLEVALRLGSRGRGSNMVVTLVKE